jgi:DNA modification methylase
MPIDKVIPYARNPRHNDGAVAKVAGSLKEFGFRQPIVVDSEMVVVVGHTRLDAARSLGLKKVPVHVAHDMSEVQAKAYRIADNKTGEFAEWDKDLLGMEFTELQEFDFDVELTGFDLRKVNSLISAETVGIDDDVIPVVPDNPVANIGDIWVLGDHYVICGDCRMIETWQAISVEGIDLVVTSPPYNVGKNYDEHNDNQCETDYMSDMRAAMKSSFVSMKSGRMIAWNVGATPQCAPWDHVKLLQSTGFDISRQIIWKKAGVPKPIYQNSMRDLAARHYVPNYRHELIYLASKGDVEYGAETDMPQDASDDVWEISTSNIEQTAHPAAFPVDLAARLISILSAEDEIICDPFAGTGTTLIASEHLNRRGIMIEKSPGYVDVIVQRWQEFTGGEATRQT